MSNEVKLTTKIKGKIDDFLYGWSWGFAFKLILGVLFLIVVIGNGISGGGQDVYP